MYVRVGRIEGARALAEFAGKCQPKFNEHGQATTDRELTRSVYYPILADWFPGEWIHCTLAVVMPNGLIHLHRDGDLGERRYMAVLQTNPEAWAFHDGDWQQLEEGSIYTADPKAEHGAVNWGSEPRIHFIVDVR